MDTLLLDLTTWDYVVDASGNWAVASGTYAISQDVASACRLILGELYYDSTQGIPYVNFRGNTGVIMGENPSLAVLQEYLVKAAKSVPGVASATAVISSYDQSTREVAGQIQFTTTSGDSGSTTL